MAAPITERALDIIKNCPADLVSLASSRTSRSSNHQSRFEGLLGLWSSFESSVRQNTKAITWEEHQTILQLRHDGTTKSLDHEHYICGDEISVSGRFVQNVLHPLIAVGKELGQGIRWGDSKELMKSMRYHCALPSGSAIALLVQWYYLIALLVQWYYLVMSPGFVQVVL